MYLPRIFPHHPLPIFQWNAVRRRIEEGVRRILRSRGTNKRQYQKETQSESGTHRLGLEVRKPPGATFSAMKNCFGTTGFGKVLNVIMTSLLIGRFQPLHEGHANLVR